MTSIDTATRSIAAAAPRPPGEPAPELLDYRLVHRAMTMDLDRLAAVASELLERPDPSRWAMLRHYLNGVSGEVESHHHVEDDHVWPFLAEVAGEHTSLTRLTQDHERLDPLLHRARRLAADEAATPEFADLLRDISTFVARHVTDEEDDVFPLIERWVSVEDYRRLQQRFRANLRLRLLPFVVPWAVSHATSKERSAVIASASWPLRVLLTLFEPRFRARQQLLFAPDVRSAADRKRVKTMRRLAAVHTARHRQRSVHRDSDSRIRDCTLGMDAEERLALLRRHWQFAATDQDITHEIYHDDAVLEFPQSGERFEGVENFREWRRIYPTELAFKMRRARGEADLWVVENSIRYGDGAWQPTVNILKFRGDKVAHETIYITDPWEPPEWRAPWRSAP